MLGSLQLLSYCFMCHCMLSSLLHVVVYALVINNNLLCTCALSCFKSWPQYATVIPFAFKSYMCKCCHYIVMFFHTCFTLYSFYRVTVHTVTYQDTRYKVVLQYTLLSRHKVVLQYTLLSRHKVVLQYTLLSRHMVECYTTHCYQDTSHNLFIVVYKIFSFCFTTQ